MSRPTRVRRWIVFLSLAVLLFAAVVGSVAVGANPISPRIVVAALFGFADDPGSEMIVMKLRLPRTLAACLIGAALAVSGVLMQSVFRNPLASPDLMGANGGASVAAVAFLTLTGGRYSVHWLPAVAAAGAFAAALLIYALAWSRSVSPYRLLLIGIGVAAAASALTTFLLISGPAYLASQVVNWLTGTVYGMSWMHVYAMLPWMLVFLPCSWAMFRQMNVLSLGDETAAGLGAAPAGIRLLLLLFSVSLAGAAVGIAGGIGFIGLMAPHMARLLVGSAHGPLVPASALIGAVMLIGADVAGRTVFAPLDMPAGVFTAALGAPFFFALLYFRKERIVR